MSIQMYGRYGSTPRRPTSARDERHRGAGRVVVERAIERVTNCYNHIGESVLRLTIHRNVLRTKLAEFRAVVDRENDDRLREKLTKSERYLAPRVDNAVKAGREAYDAYDDAWLGGSGFIDRNGFNPPQQRRGPVDENHPRRGRQHPDCAEHPSWQVDALARKVCRRGRPRTRQGLRAKS
jgi:hypothetical protein